MSGHYLTILWEFSDSIYLKKYIKYNYEEQVQVWFPTF
jgi:hypothetical protein